MNIPTFFPLEIESVDPETDQAISVTFRVDPENAERFGFIQGQYLTFRIEINGEEIRRSYSICSGLDDGHLRVGIKRVSGGKFSNYANDHFRAGMIIAAMPPQGNFHTTLSSSHRKSYMCIAAGSGITPVLSIVKSVLEREPESQITLIYGNRTTQTMMFREELGFVKNRHMQRFSWINIMDEEDQGADLLNGIIDNAKGTALHRARLINLFDTDEVFICGPEAMMSEVSRGFRSVNFEESRLHYELFANSAEDSELVMEKSRQRVATYGETKTSKVKLTADGRTTQFELATVGENILDAGIHHSLDLPFSCKAGVCSTCKARLVDGCVEMDLTHALEQHEIDAGYILTCQAHPVSESVEVDFDKR